MVKTNFKNFIKRALALLLIITQVAILAACGEEPATTSFGEDWLLNTYCYISVNEPGKEAVISEAFKLARDYENKLSRTIPTSQVATGNFDEETQVLVDQALAFEESTAGAFNIHLGAVSALWDFSGSNGGPFIPSEEEIAKALEEQVLDLGAIAKGYIADKVSEYLKSNGVSSAIISLGGNIICLGVKSDGTNFKVGIEKPFGEKGTPLEQRESIGTVICPPDYSVVTSGIYERCFTADDGTFYHHILNNETGYPAETELASATIVGPSSCICDALATICILDGPSKGIEFMKDFPEYKAVFITTQGDIIDSFEILNMIK